MSGTINYKIDCQIEDGDCMEDTDYTDCDFEHDEETLETYKATNVCNYADIGIYTAKVHVQRGDLGGLEDTVTIEVTASEPPPSVDPIIEDPGGDPIEEVIVDDPVVIVPDTPDEDIVEVRFVSDESQDDTPPPSDSPLWTDWYDWNESSGAWDAVNKEMGWSFSTEGDKEVWVEVRDNSGQTAQASEDITVYLPNDPPVASIICYPNGCDQTAGVCTGYTQSNFCLKNNSTDPDNNINNSIWTITGEMADISDCLAVSGNPICNWTPISTFPAGSYLAQLYVEDERGESDISDVYPFTILQDAIADFMCSLDNDTWQDCDTIRVSEDERVYFKDQKNLLRHSSPSDPESGTEIDYYWWEFEDGTPAAVEGRKKINPSATFEALSAGSGIVTLTITDSAGRSDTVSYRVQVTVPLPEWRETPPF